MPAREEAAEAIGVTFLMNGGPATVYGARAFAAVQEFYAERVSAPSGACSRRLTIGALPRGRGHAAKNWPIPRLSSAVSSTPLWSMSRKPNAHSASSAVVP